MLPSELQIFSADAAKLRDIEASASSGRVRSKAQVLGLDMMVGLWVIHSRKIGSRTGTGSTQVSEAHERTPSR